MIYVLLEQEKNIINSVEYEFVSRYHKDSIKRFGRERLSYSEFDRFRVPPLFDSGWLIIASALSRTQILKCLPEKNVLLLKVTRRSLLSDVLETLDGLSYKVIDNYVVDKEIVQAYIQKELKCTPSIASYLYGRQQGRISAIVNAIDVLKLLPKVTRSTINQYTEKINSVTPVGVVQYMLGISESIRQDELIDFLYSFRYADKWLRAELLKQLELYYLTFSAVDSGELTLQNFREFLEVAPRQFKDCKEYTLKKMIEAHKYVSCELVMFLKLQISSLPASELFLRGVMELVKVGGNNVFSV